mgnify:CR=1 FL=1
MAIPTKEVLNLDALAEYLEVSKSTLYKLAQRKSLPGQKVGKQWRFHKTAIKEWLCQPAKRESMRGKSR